MMTSNRQPNKKPDLPLYSAAIFHRFAAKAKLDVLQSKPYDRVHEHAIAV